MAASVVTSAAQWIGSLLIHEASTLLEVTDQVRGLQEELEFMQQYLQDADTKQELREVRPLIGQVRKLTYDVEDVIDTYILKAQQRVGQNSRSRLMRYACFLYTAPSIYDLGKQIQVIQSSMKRTMDNFNKYGVRRIPEFQEDFRLSNDERYWRQKPQSYSYDDNNGEYVVGLEKDIPKLVEVLMGEGKSQVNVLAIVGMGGSGKTTLARKLYNHPYTNKCFDCKAWVFISQKWSSRHVLSEILRNVGSPKEKTKLHARSSVEELVDKLRGILEKKSYLVVLDDVWRREAIREILPALPKGNIKKAGKIIITTRNREIIEFQTLQSYMDIHEPLPLSEEEGWELFSKIALSHRTNYNEDSFESLGKEMLRKCDGLPLAIVALAGILSTRGSIGEWQRVREAVRSRVMNGTCTHGRVEDLLALSYDDLPYYLKPCFLHLAVFPEDCQIPAGMLTRMWIAEGLVTAQGERDLEDVAVQRLEELGHRFMIQVVRTNFKGEIKAIRLHDLLRDLCVKKAKEQSFLQVCTPVNDPAVSDASAIVVQPRRAALHSNLSFPTQVSNLRSLVLLTRSSISHSAYVSKETVDLEVLHYFKLLRLLNLWGIKTANGTLPSQIGNLIHLRYLGIRATNITELPTSMENLRNLLTLDYRNVESDNNVPIRIPNIWMKLGLLRHLFLPIECPWDVEDLQLSAMKNLRTLWGVKHDAGGNWFSREGPKLSTNLKKLKIAVSTKVDLDAAFSCPSFMSDGLRTFHCEWKEGVALQLMEPISRHRPLHKLILIGKIQMKLSLILPSNLAVLKLKDSMLNDEDPMAAIGTLAHLKLLRLSNAYAGTTFACDPGSFPQLEELYLENFLNLKMWRIEKGAMPCLKRIEIIGCRKLGNFPHGLAFITTLQQLEFFGVPKEFAQKARESGWSEKRLRLPHNCEAIIELSDSPVDTSSIGKLYEQLNSGIFLKNKTQKYWILNQDGHYCNCFMVYALDLRLRMPQYKMGGMKTEYTYSNVEDGPYVECSKTTERSGDSTLLTVAKLKPSIFPPAVIGKFNTGNLSHYITYEIAWVIMLVKSAELSGTLFVDEVDYDTIVFSKLILPGQNTRLHQQRQTDEEKLDLDNFCDDYREILDDMPTNEWIRIRAGEFEASPEIVGDLTLSLQYREGIKRLALMIKGFIIEPKL